MCFVFILQRGPLKLFYSIYEVPVLSKRMKFSTAEDKSFKKEIRSFPVSKSSTPSQADKMATSGGSDSTTSNSMAEKTPGKEKEATTKTPGKEDSSVKEREATPQKVTPKPVHPHKTKPVSPKAKHVSPKAKRPVGRPPKLTPVPRPTVSTIPTTQGMGTVGGSNSAFSKVDNKSATKAALAAPPKHPPPSLSSILPAPEKPPKRKGPGRPPKNPNAPPKVPKPSPKGTGPKGHRGPGRPPKGLAPLLKIASSQAKQISSNARSPVTQAKPFHLVPRTGGAPPPPQSPAKTVNTPTPSASSQSGINQPVFPQNMRHSVPVSIPLNEAKSTHGKLNTPSGSSTNVTSPSQPKSTQPNPSLAKPTQQKPTQQKPSHPKPTQLTSSPKKPEGNLNKNSKPKCINAITNKLLASKGAVESPPRTDVTLQTPGTPVHKPVMSSQGTSPMSPHVTPQGVSNSSPLNTPSRQVGKSCSSGTQTGSPPQQSRATGRPQTSTTNVATSPLASTINKSTDPKKDLGSVNSNKLPVPLGNSQQRKSQISPTRNIFSDFTVQKPPGPQTTLVNQVKAHSNPISSQAQGSGTPKNSSSNAKSEMPVKKDSGTGPISPPLPFKPHVAAALAPTPPKRPYAPVASHSPGASHLSPMPLKLKSPIDITQAPLKPPSSDMQKQEVSQNKDGGTSSSSGSHDQMSEARGPEQEVPLDLGTRKFVPVK